MPLLQSQFIAVESGKAKQQLMTGADLGVSVIAEGSAFLTGVQRF